MNTLANDRWLSEGAEVLIEEIEKADATNPGVLHCEVLIIGSGYGGAVAAARLAAATPKAGGDPVKVYVLERGNEYLPGEFPATFAEVPAHVRFSNQDGLPPRGRPTGLFDLRIGKTVSALLGNGLGGGSLINAAVMEETHARTHSSIAGPRASVSGPWPATTGRPRPCSPASRFRAACRSWIR